MKTNNAGRNLAGLEAESCRKLVRREFRGLARMEKDSRTRTTLSNMTAGEQRKGHYVARTDRLAGCIANRNPYLNSNLRQGMLIIRYER
ncbi:MAG TPA: hypothetical protein VG347_15290 [Verrucomicrobiae bacterium]|nr:hypothetical protein [Verrucomicrobiae bacterium]